LMEQDPPMICSTTANLEVGFFKKNSKMGTI
jgi:hypothetical protein